MLNDFFLNCVITLKQIWNKENALELDDTRIIELTNNLLEIHSSEQALLNVHFFILLDMIKNKKLFVDFLEIATKKFDLEKIIIVKQKLGFLNEKEQIKAIKILRKFTEWNLKIRNEKRLMHLIFAEGFSNIFLNNYILAFLQDYNWNDWNFWFSNNVYAEDIIKLYQIEKDFNQKYLRNIFCDFENDFRNNLLDYLNFHLNMNLEKEMTIKKFEHIFNLKYLLSVLKNRNEIWNEKLSINDLLNQGLSFNTSFKNNIIGFEDYIQMFVNLKPELKNQFIYEYYHFSPAKLNYDSFEYILNCLKNLRNSCVHGLTFYKQKFLDVNFLLRKAKIYINDKNNKVNDKQKIISTAHFKDNDFVTKEKFIKLICDNEGLQKYCSFTLQNQINSSFFGNRKIDIWNLRILDAIKILQGLYQTKIKILQKAINAFRDKFLNYIQFELKNNPQAIYYFLQKTKIIVDFLPVKFKTIIWNIELIVLYINHK